MTFAFTRDFATIRAVLTHPTQHRMASDDATDYASWSPSEDERVWYIEAREGGELLGIFPVAPQNAACYEIHAAVLPCAWGARSRIALRGAIEFLWSMTFNMNMGTGIPRIVASIPAYNKLAIKLARDVGMRAFGRNPASFLRGGKLHDQILVGLSRP